VCTEVNSSRSKQDEEKLNSRNLNCCGGCESVGNLVVQLQREISELKSQNNSIIEMMKKWEGMSSSHPTPMRQSAQIVPKHDLKKNKNNGEIRNNTNQEGMKLNVNMQQQETSLKKVRDISNYTGSKPSEYPNHKAARAANVDIKLKRKQNDFFVGNLENTQICAVPTREKKTSKEYLLAE
jgi:hypothetical protein